VTLAQETRSGRVRWSSSNPRIALQRWATSWVPMLYTLSTSVYLMYWRVDGSFSRNVMANKSGSARSCWSEKEGGDVDGKDSGRTVADTEIRLVNIMYYFTICTRS
jgi:hypothetical protein